MQVGYVSKEKDNEPVLLQPDDFVTAGRYEVIKQKISMLSAVVEAAIFLF